MTDSLEPFLIGNLLPVNIQPKILYGFVQFAGGLVMMVTLLADLQGLMNLPLDMNSFCPVVSIEARCHIGR